MKKFFYKSFVHINKFCNKIVSWKTQKEYDSLIDEVRRNQILQIADEASLYLEELNNHLFKNQNIKDLYHGFYLFDGKVNLNCTILFIGENPEAFSWNHSYPPSVYLESETANPSSFTIYIKQMLNSHRIADETISLLKICGLDETEIKFLFEKEITRIFLYPLILNYVELQDFFNRYDKYFFEEFRFKSRLWTKKLIDTIQPKTIICESKTVFDELSIKLNFENTDWSDNVGIAAISHNNQKTLLIGIGNKEGTFLNKEKVTQIIKTHSIL